MTDYEQQRMDGLTMQVAQLRGLVEQLAREGQSLAKELQATRDILEALGATSGLEWLPEVRAWVSREKLQALRMSPRGE